MSGMWGRVRVMSGMREGYRSICMVIRMWRWLV